MRATNLLWQAGVNSTQLCRSLLYASFVLSVVPSLLQFIFFHTISYEDISELYSERFFKLVYLLQSIACNSQLLALISHMMSLMAHLVHCLALNQKLLCAL